MGFHPSDWSDPNATAVAMAIAVVGALLGLWLHAARARSWPAWWLLAPALAIAGATLVRVVVTSGIDSDESEHLHVAYLLANGVLPYRDFDQNHAPFLWMLTAPLLRLLPESPYLLYLFRALSLASFVGSVAAACSIARQPSRGGALVAPLCVFVALATAVNTEVYRFRPDPFMNLCALLSLRALLRPGGDLTRQALLAGVLQGLSIALSPKLAHLALLAPIALLMRDRRDVWRGLFGYGAGVLLALLPLFAWLAWNGLLQDASASVIGNNLASTSSRAAEAMPADPRATAVSTTVLEPLRLLQLSPIIILTLIGALQTYRKQRSEGTPAMTPLVVAAWLSWLGVWAITPNAASYHIAGALVLGAALAAPALDRLASLRRRWAPLALGILLSLCLSSAPLRSGVGGWVEGYTYPLARVAWLLDAVRSRGGGCLCLVPWHPIFIATVSPVYVSNERGSRRWGEALEWAAQHRPAAIMSRRFYRMAERGQISQGQADRTMQLLSERYQLRSAGTAGFWLRKERDSR